MRAYFTSPFKKMVNSISPVQWRLMVETIILSKSIKLLLFSVLDLKEITLCHLCSPSLEARLRRRGRPVAGVADQLLERARPAARGGAVAGVVAVSVRLEQEREREKRV